MLKKFSHLYPFVEQEDPDFFENAKVMQGPSYMVSQNYPISKSPSSEKYLNSAAS